jgi:hypothetical protein
MKRFTHPGPATTPAWVAEKASVAATGVMDRPTQRGLPLLSTVLSTVLIALAVAPAATANKPTREIIRGQNDVLLTDQCVFPVLIHTAGREIVTTFTDKAGNLVKQIAIFPANKQTLTNLDTGESITVVATGPFHGRRNPDGSATVRVTGHGIFPGHPITEEPGIWFLSGRIFATLDAEENLTSIDSTGKLVDLCPRLADARE